LKAVMMDIGVHLPEVYANRHFIRRKNSIYQLKQYCRLRKYSNRYPTISIQL